MVGILNDLRGEYAFEKGSPRDPSSSESRMRDGNSSSRPPTQSANNPIVIESDEDDHDTIAAKGSRRHAPPYTVKHEAYDGDDAGLSAKDAIRIKLSKLDAEVSYFSTFLRMNLTCQDQRD